MKSHSTSSVEVQARCLAQSSGSDQRTSNQWVITGTYSGGNKFFRTASSEICGDPTLAPWIPSLVCVLNADANGTGKNDGPDWKDAYNLRQGALADADLSWE